MWNFWNRLMNTIDVAPRAVWTAWSGVLDLVSAPLYWVLNFSERMWTRTANIKEAIRNATNTWPNWKRWIRRPLAYVSWAWSFLTWAVRAAVASGRDTVWYVLKALWNTFNNAWSAVMRMWEPPQPKSFSFAKLEPENTPMKSVLPRRFPALAATPTPAVATP